MRNQNLSSESGDGVQAVGNWLHTAVLNKFKILRLMEARLVLPEKGAANTELEKSRMNSVVWSWN